MSGLSCFSIPQRKTVKERPIRRRMSTRLLLLAGLLATTLGCATIQGPPPGSPATPGLPAPSAGPDVEARALLLLLEDRRLYEPVSLFRALEGGPELRRAAALTLGRLGDPRGGPTLELLLADDSAAVRRTAAFALGELGELGYTKGAGPLLGATLDTDRETGRLAVEALAKTGVSLESVIQRLITGATEELLPRLVPSLFRFESEAVVRWAEQGLELEDDRLRALAAYGLGREPRAAGAPLLRQLLADPDPWIRGWAARGLGGVGYRSDLDLLRPLLDDSEPGPIIQALRATRRLIAAGAAAPPEAWRPRLLELLTDPRPGVRLTAIEVSAVWLLDTDLGAALEVFATQGSRRERELALLALAEGEDPRAAALALRFAAEHDPALRRRAAEAAGFFRSLEVLGRLFRDVDPGVRVAALEIWLEVEPELAIGLVELALGDEDPVVRASALGWLEENPEFPASELWTAAQRARADRLLDARIASVRALAARARAHAEEAEGIEIYLAELAKEPEFLVRREAVRALESLGVEPPRLGGVKNRKSVESYRQVVRSMSGKRRVEIHTARGVITAELDCPQAPLTCVSFLQLAAQGFYDGLELHRVVPDFVVQGGDPRGDGAGGPGYTLRDEIGLLRFDRPGVLGMAHSGPDTAGSQFFITLSAQPHLDGTYTVFGSVVSGMEVVHELVQGERILRISAVPG